MAKPKKSVPPPPDPASAAAKIEEPKIKWSTIGLIAAAVLVLWVTSFMMVPTIGYWGVGVVGVLTLVAAGFGFYVWRLARRSRAIVDILKSATDAPSRKAALEKLSAGDEKDALNALARAQLVAQEKPTEAIEILEKVDLKKAPVMVQDDVRANLAFLYLMTGRMRDARGLADDIRLDRSPHAKSKAMYAAVIAESFSRTGKHDEARKLLETYKDDDPEYGEMSALLLRAQVYTYFATKNRGLARKAMEKLVGRDANMLASFMQKGAPIELQKMAREVLTGSGLGPKVKMKVQRR